jgi:hypothetical protein
VEHHHFIRLGPHRSLINGRTRTWLRSTKP